MNFSLEETLTILAVVPTVGGVLILSMCLYFQIFKPNRDKFWGCFITGSLLMASGLICGIGLADGGIIAGTFLVSGLVWLFQCAIFLSCTGYQDSYHNAQRITNMLGNVTTQLVVSNKDKENLAGVYATWDRENSTAEDFRYEIMVVKEKDTYLNTMRKEQHYTIKYVEENFKTIEECKAYVEKLDFTPTKVKKL